MRAYRAVPQFSDKSIEKFWARVDRRSETECWLWLGIRTVGKCGAQYGIFNGFGSHRIAYTLLRGPIPKGLTLDHVASLCPMGSLCANPWHLEPVTQKENQNRHYALQTKCKRGHDRIPFTGRCQTCEAEFRENYKAIQRERYQQKKRERESPSTAVSRTPAAFFSEVTV